MPLDPRSCDIATGTATRGSRPLSPAEWTACPFCTQGEALRELALARAAPRRAHVVVRVYAAQRKPVASGRGASGLAGRPPGGSSSL